MKTSSTYYQSALEYEALLMKMVDCITKAVDVEKIYILSLTTAQYTTKSLFSVEPLTVAIPWHCHLLVVIKNAESAPLNSVQDKLEAHLQQVLQSSVLVILLDQFSNWLLGKNGFTVSVYNNGLLLYSKESTVDPFQHTKGAVIDKDNVKLIAQAKVKAQAFLAGSELYTIRQQYKMAAFMLHQAAEQALRTSLFINTGLLLNTHNVIKLLWYNAMFSSHSLALVLPNKENIKLFRLLQQAYIGARYKDEEFTINLKAIVELTNSVKSFIEEL